MKKQLLNPKFKKHFGIWLGLYNSLTGSKWTVKEASNDSKMVKIFSKTSVSLLKGKKDIPKFINTSAEAFDKLDFQPLDFDVYRFITKNPDLTRHEIAHKMGIQLSTICGSIRRLIDDGHIKVIGYRRDIETGISRQTLGLINVE